MSHRDVAEMFVHPTTTAGCLLLSLYTHEDLQDKQKLLQQIMEILITYPTEVFPPAMLQENFQWQHNTWHQVTITIVIKL